MTQSLALYLGGRSFQEDLEPAEDHSLVGIEYATQTPGAAMGWEFGIQYSENVLSGFDFDLFGSTTLDASSLELYGGVRKTFREQAAFRPYVGGGLSVIKVDLDLDSPSPQSDSATVLGLYVHAGAAYAFNQTFALGLDYRILIADDAKLFGFENDVDYGQLALTLSFRF